LTYDTTEVTMVVSNRRIQPNRVVSAGRNPRGRGFRPLNNNR